MTKRLFELIRRGWRKPPHVIVHWLARQAGAELDQRMAPSRVRWLDGDRLLGLLGEENLDSLWARLGAAPFPAFLGPVDQDSLEDLSTGETARILAAAEDAIAHRVDFLGSGPTAPSRENGSNGAGKSSPTSCRSKSLPTASISKSPPPITGWSRKSSCCRRYTAAP
jgi:hypothetical protein